LNECGTLEVQKLPADHRQVLADLDLPTSVIEHLKLCGVILEGKPPPKTRSTGHFMGPRET
jgi:hypothetical protein